MRTGLVDETWAKEHHRYWYDDIKAGKIDAEPPSPVAGTGQPASGQAH
jgi:formate dehydrogenase subunit gamma